MRKPNRSSMSRSRAHQTPMSTTTSKERSKSRSSLSITRRSAIPASPNPSCSCPVSISSKHGAHPAAAQSTKASSTKHRPALAAMRPASSPLKNRQPFTSMSAARARTQSSIRHPSQAAITAAAQARGIPQTTKRQAAAAAQQTSAWSAATWSGAVTPLLAAWMARARILVRMSFISSRLG